MRFDDSASIEGLAVLGPWRAGSVRADLRVHRLLGEKHPAQERLDRRYAGDSRYVAGQFAAHTYQFAALLVPIAPLFYELLKR